MWPDPFNGNPHGDAAFGYCLFSNIVPVRRLSPDYPVPVENDIHRLRLGDDLRPAVDLNVFGTVELLAEDQQGDPRVLEQFEANEVPHTPVYNMAEVFQDPQIKHMGLEIQIERQTKPTIRTVKFPVDYSETKVPHPGPPPELGEHNGELLKALGYDNKAIDELKEKGVIGGDSP